MAKILLATLNAKYIHASFGLRYLLANLGELRTQATLVEFDLSQRPLEIVETILGSNPAIVGFGVYIWNVEPTRQVISTLKRLRPDLTIVLGGPEVSYETDRQSIIDAADYVVTGEADLAFAQLCRLLLAGNAPPHKIIAAPLPALEEIALPYDLYTDDDVAHRVVYVEASRGCPFSCEFCLSSLDIPVRQFPLPQLLNAFERLLERGVRQFKFVDRTFNLNVQVGIRLLEFFHQHYRPDLFLHFEMIPDRLPDAVRERITRFPPGTLQFEIGIQTFNPEVSDLISRRQDLTKLEANLRFLREETGVHIHADLIAGLPGESFESFGAGFDRLLELRPQEIQVGILKRLRGTPITRHDQPFQMVYSPDPPYEILQNRHLDFPTLQRLRRFARYWDLVYNSGRFVETTPLIWSNRPSAFDAFLHWSDWLYQHAGRRHGIALNRLAEFLYQYLIRETAADPGRVGAALRADFIRAGRSDTPAFLRPLPGTDAPAKDPDHASSRASPAPTAELENPALARALGPGHTRRQQRHRGLRPD
jgi:radical SAM superfamily enzyme YgiQ (UPF0313 family)